MSDFGLILGYYEFDYYKFIYLDLIIFEIFGKFYL